MEQTSATMFEAITVTSLSSRIWADVCSAMISRKRRRSRRGPPPTDISRLLSGLGPRFYFGRTAGRKSANALFLAVAPGHHRRTLVGSFRGRARAFILVARPDAKAQMRFSLPLLLATTDGH